MHDALHVHVCFCRPLTEQLGLVPPICMWAMVGFAVYSPILSLPSKTCLGCVHSGLEYVHSSITLVLFVVAGAYHLYGLHGLPVYQCIKEVWLVFTAA